MTALVVGGTRGIGRAIALRLARDGHDIGLSFLADTSSAEQTQALINTKSTLLPGDMSDPDVVTRSFDTLERELGGIDIVVHAAVIPILVNGTTCTPADLDRAYQVGPRSFLLLCQEGAKRMHGGGSIVMVSSIAVGRSSPGYVALGAAKSAQEYLVRSFAVELAPLGIRVNAVRSPTIDGPYVEAHPKADRLREAIAKKTPVGRIGTEDDIASAVSLLCSPDARFIVGQCFAADGGFTVPL